MSREKEVNDYTEPKLIKPATVKQIAANESGGRMSKLEQEVRAITGPSAPGKAGLKKSEAADIQEQLV